MRVRVLVSLLLVFALLLCSCTKSSEEKNPKYTVYEKEGKTYMEFLPEDGQSDDDSSQQMNSEVIIYPSFDSVAEMREKILSGNIPDDQLSGLRYSAGEDNVLEIFDLNKLYEAGLPEGMNYNFVGWDGYSYSFDIGQVGNGETYGMVRCLDQESYVKEYDKKYTYYTTFNSVTVIGDTATDDRDARVIHFKNHTGEYMDILYSITTPSGTVHVIEMYCLNHRYGLTEESETVPRKVCLFGDEGDRYFYAWFMGFEERPAVDWLSSFSLIPA